MKNRLPAMYGFREFVDAGGLIAYGVNVPYLCRSAAVYVDKIIKGTKPADLPVQQPTRFELVLPSGNDGLILAQPVSGFASMVQRKGLAMVRLK